MKFLLSLFGFFCILSVFAQTSEKQKALLTPAPKTRVLNFGTFHMGLTNDAHKTEFDETDEKNRNAVHEIARKLAAFEPTVIVVESLPASDSLLQAEYRQYLTNPGMRLENPSEIELLAYEVGRLSGTGRIFGIDHKMGYDYNIGGKIDNRIDADWYDKFYADPLRYYPEINVESDSLDLLGKLQHANHGRYLDFLIAANADMLTHAGSETGFEGADEAAKFYQRNLRMYSNLNRLDLRPDDRVFILLGSGHTAYFRDFMKRSPKYHVVDTFEYLK